MAKPNAFGAELLEHVLNNVAIANVGDAAGLPVSATNGSLYVALHTADPGETGNQSTSECAYTSYTRKAVARNPSSKKWTVTTADPAAATNAAEVLFVEASGGTETATHFSVGKESSGATDILYKGALTSSLAISTGVQPRFAAGALDITED